MKTRTWITTVAAGLITAGVAVAQPDGNGGPRGGNGQGGGRPGGPRHRDPAEVFARIDEDDSGELSLAELTAAHERRTAARDERGGPRRKHPGRGEDWTPPTAEQVFEHMDADGSGGVTLEEFKTALANRPRRPRGGPGGEGRPPRGEDGEGRGPRGGPGGQGRGPRWQEDAEE